jgi:hypothetical protein
MKGIILDGVAAAGKSTTLQHLQTKIITEKAGSTKLFISEHYTQRMLEDKLHSGQLTAPLLKEHVDTLIDGLVSYQRMLENSKFAASPSRAEAFVTIERFLLTFFATLPDILQEYGVATAKQQFSALASCGLTHYLIVLSPEKIRANVTQTLTHRNEFWTAHIESKGGLEKAIAEYVDWQTKLLDFARLFEDQIKTEIIELKDQSYEAVADEIYGKVFQ